MGKLRELLLGHITEIVIILLGIVFTSLSTMLAPALVPLISENITTTHWLKLVLALFVLIIFLLLYVAALYFKNKNPITSLQKKHIFLNDLGIYKNKKTECYFCTSCILAGIESPLTVLKAGWQCERKECGKYYSNPEYKPPKIATTQGLSNW